MIPSMAVVMTPAFFNSSVRSDVALVELIDLWTERGPLTNCGGLQVSGGESVPSWPVVASACW